MSSDGKTKFQKYFSESSTKTIMKHDSPLMGMDGANLGMTIPRGAEIDVLGGEYHPKVTILYENKKYRVRLTDVEKPIHINKVVRFPLKPDRLSLCGSFKAARYSSAVIKAIQGHKELPCRVQEYLVSLVLHAAGKRSDLDAAFKNLNGDAALKNSIDSDFMEVLGPLLVLKERPELQGGEIFFPEAGNEPLYDFSISKNGVTHLFSSKNGTGSVNTLKAALVYDRVVGDLKIRRKYKRELELLRIIKATRAKQAPDVINDWLAETFSAYSIQKPSTDVQSAVLLERYVVNFINSSDLKFLPLVKAALPDVTYVRANTDSTGFPKLKSLIHGEAVQRAVFRSKSSPGHLTDKLGFDL